MAKKTALDQLVMSPVMLLAFFAAVKLMEGSPGEIVPYVQASSGPGRLYQRIVRPAVLAAAGTSAGATPLLRLGGSPAAAPASPWRPPARVPFSSFQAKFTSTLLAGYALWVPYNVAGAWGSSGLPLGTRHVLPNWCLTNCADWRYACPVLVA